MSIKIQAKYKQYCAAMKASKELPLIYLRWLEVELQSHMDFRDTIEPCSICAGYMLKRSNKGE